jgi:hypothetical protein
MGKKYLDRLIGKKLIDARFSTSTIFPLKKGELKIPVSPLIELILYFQDYILTIFSPISILPSDKAVNDLIGFEIIETNESIYKAELVFDNKSKIEVDMRAEAYFGPEAMELSGSGFIIQLSAYLLVI